MTTEIKIPSPGESITEVLLANWLVENNSYVEQNQEIAEIDSDKATLTISAPDSGIINFSVAAGETVEVGKVVATIVHGEADKQNIKQVSTPKATIEPITVQSAEVKIENINHDITGAPGQQLHSSPLARKLMETENITESELLNFFSHYRLGTKDIEFFKENRNSTEKSIESGVKDTTTNAVNREPLRKKMTPLRKKLSERLVSVKNETAMLTTFNEVNMTPIMEIRKKYKEIFKEKHNVNLGFMSFFTKAVTEALQLFPQVNSQIDGDEIVSFNYTDISIAVSGPKGLVVPVIRNAEKLSLAEIETIIKTLATKARDNKLSLEEMTGGTFTITNGGVFGSMLSTPIINPPQSAILGMHNIVERPIAVNGNVEIHPIMFVALSYDHRIIDGRESVSFLVKVKEMLENPSKMLFGSKDPVEKLLDL
ncbi:MAG: 2-oxoglutarate dehydrogenase complex dihydrolipoyllysine-residue succinyltransferase [Bacteroidales bacterium]|nr:2-oxoglutarate dehydrogenase complex dihydrolipoyllysine-residue succinyltransferase [Bacteroidales bacterium]